MKFYIVTPTFNSLGWLERAVRSVADQSGQGVEVHHHVQDGGSTDGTAAWLEAWQREHADMPGYTFTYVSAKDAGMYDALNKAWEAMPADADVTAHLNSDEQYLPGAFQGIAEGFASHPSADIILSSHFVLDAQDRYICHRWPVTPQKWVSRCVCEMITCACFHKASIFRRHGIRFDTRWRSIGDLVLYRDIMETSPNVVALADVFTTSFTVTGSNLGWSEVTDREWVTLLAEMSSAARICRRIAGLWCNLKRRSKDCIHRAPRTYAVYPAGSAVREEHAIKHPTSHWGCRTEGEQ